MNEPVSRQEIAALLGLARLLASDRNQAEDLVQECLLRALVHRGRLEGAHHRPAYLRRMLVNVSLDQRRAHRRRPATTSLEGVDAAGPDAPDLADSDALWTSVLGLPARQRACVVLRYYEDLDTDEIADWLGIGASAVRSNLARALATLRVATTDDEGSTGPWIVHRKH